MESYRLEDREDREKTKVASVKECCVGSTHFEETSYDTDE